MSGTVEFVGDGSLAEHEHAMAQVGDLLGVRGVEQDRATVGRELDHKLVDVLLGGDVDAARDVVQQQDLRVGQEPSTEQDLLLVSAAQRAHRLARTARVDRRRSIMPPAALRSPAGRITPAEASRFRMGRVRFSRTVIGSSSPSALRSWGMNAMPASMASRGLCRRIRSPRT